MMNVHSIGGCAPAPLAHYLKALGLLRVVAEQADPEARGWWEGESFHLATVLDADALAEFLLCRYAPTAFVAPWNKGSGFYKPNDPGLTPLKSSSAVRFSAFRSAIADVLVILEDIEKADREVRSIKALPKGRHLSRAEREGMRGSDDYKKKLAAAEKVFKGLKAELITNARASWRGNHLRWMNAAMVIDDLGAAKFPALLGTGGNDGNLDFTNNFMQRLNEVFDLASDEGGPRSPAHGWLMGALWGRAAHSCLADRAVGQYLPGMAGGANSANGADAESLLNPFDYLFMMEGCLLFAAHAVRRLTQGGPSRAAAPFVVSSHAAGYASAASSDEAARGEQWMPLWQQPMTLGETQRLFAEGRAQLGSNSAREPLDLARAATRLGVSRGITAFQRFGYIERNGQSNLAVPLGRFEVLDEPATQAAALDDLGHWQHRLRQQARDDKASTRLISVERRLGDALFDVAQHPTEPSRWQSTLLALGEVESVMRSGSGFKAQPVPRLRPDWARAADDGSPEFRLALTFALQAGVHSARSARPFDPVRRHWLPLDPAYPGRFATSGEVMRPRLDKRPEVVIDGRDGLSDAIALLERRMTEGAMKGTRSFPLQASPKAPAHLADLAAWLAGKVDTDRTMALARALMALDGEQWSRHGGGLVQPIPGPWPDDAWLVLRLAHQREPLPNGRIVPCDPAILRRLASGDAATAVSMAARRLQASGLRLGVRVASTSAATARLWAAALVFPIHHRVVARIVERLDPAFYQEHLS
jgi:CRISPR-associated protein Csx17